MRTSPCALNSPPRWNGGLLGWLVRTGFPGDGAGLLAESTNGVYVDLCCLFTPSDVIYPLFGLQFKHRRTEVITNEQRERILATYRPWIYGYKRIARELGLTRDQVRQVVVTTANQRRRKQMTSFEPNDYRVKKANSAYEDRDLSGYATDAEKIERLQDEIRLLRSLIVEYQKEFLPEALSEYPLFLSKDEVPLDAPSEDEGKDKDEGKGKEKKPRRSLKKKLRRRKEA